MNMKLVCLSVIAGLVLNASASKASEDIDSGVRLAENAAIQWIDDHSVMIEAGSCSFCEKENGYKEPLKRLMIFDIKTRKATWYREIGCGGLCLADGNISYYCRRHSESKCPVEQWDYYSGKFGKEQAELWNPSGGKIDRNTCRPESELLPLPAWTKGKHVRRLRDGDGFVVYETSGPARRPAKLYKYGDAETDGVVLPDVFSLTPAERYHTPSTPSYVRYKQAYLLHTTHFTYPIKEGETAVLWWLYPDGRVDEAVRYVRAKDWPYADPNMVIPTRGGIVFIGQDTKSVVPGIGMNGLYRLDAEKRPQRIVAGRIGPHALSPDGCRLAFGNDDRPHVEVAKWVYKLQVVNLCEGGRQ